MSLGRRFEYDYTRGGVRYSAPHGVHDDCVMALALAVQHHAGVSNRIDWATALTPPSEARMAVLIREEMAWRDRALREALARQEKRVLDIDDERGWPGAWGDPAAVQVLVRWTA